MASAMKSVTKVSTGPSPVTTSSHPLHAPCSRAWLLVELCLMRDVGPQAMVSMNKQVNVPALTKIMTEWAKENEKGEMMGEMLGDAMDDAMAEEGDEEEQERIVGSVLAELGLQAADAVRCRQMHTNHMRLYACL
jgi:hypothetical protein